MNFSEISELNTINNSRMYNWSNWSNWSDYQNVNNLKKIINIVNHFDSYTKFKKFMKIMEHIPTISQVSELTHDNRNLFFLKFLQTQGYFNLLDPIQKYYLFIEACTYNSINIAILIFSNLNDLDGVKEFMLNYLAQVGTETEYKIFRKIWEKNILQFNQEEIEELFFNILKTSNIEFIKWFYSLNLINLTNVRIRERIHLEILMNASNNDDYKTIIFIFSQYVIQ